MTTRMTSKTVTFRRPFILGGLSQVEPPGNYTMETEEEQIDIASGPSWKRTITIMHLKNGVTTEYHPIDPRQLREALLRDEVHEDPAVSPGPDIVAAPLAQAQVPRFVRRKKF